MAFYKFAEFYKMTLYKFRYGQDIIEADSDFALLEVAPRVYRLEPKIRFVNSKANKADDPKFCI